MNPMYAIMESPHRWYILSGLSITSAAIGAIMMMALVWPHVLARVWFWGGAILAVYFLSRAFRDWLRSVDAALKTPESATRQLTSTGQ